jgi:methyl-accepting chemotaxis protein/sigma-B regulation protein RsbU (phosphoserine phosphatase)
MMAIALVSLLLLLVLCQRFAHRQLLPLRLLTASAQRISEGHYDDVIPASRQQDEIGQLQDHFQNMQQALSANVRVLEQLRTSLQRQGEELNAAYQKAQEADRLKTAFLHNMTKEMMSPAKHIYDNVSTVCKQWDHISDDELHRLVDESQTKGKAIMQLLDKLLEKEILPELQEEPQTPECAN